MTCLLHLVCPAVPCLLLLALAGNAFCADVPAPSEFAWRATLDVPPGTGMARVNLPAEEIGRAHV